MQAGLLDLPGFLDSKVCTGRSADKFSAHASPALCRASLVYHSGSGLATLEAHPPPTCLIPLLSVPSHSQPGESVCALSSVCTPGQQECHEARDSRGARACHLSPYLGMLALHTWQPSELLAWWFSMAPSAWPCPGRDGQWVFFLLSHIRSSVFSGAQQPGLPYYTDPGGPGMNPAGNAMAMAFQAQPNSPQGSTAYPPPPSYCNTPPPPYEQVVKAK